jgi:ATP-dependent Clp protease adapter protein ClpS
VLKKSKRKSKFKELISLDNEIVVYNDDVNTFEHVIETLTQFVIILPNKQNNVH